jgi:hypothetical protein
MPKPIRNTRTRRTALSLCALFLAALLPFSAAALPLERFIFRPDPLLSALESSGFYQQYPRLLLSFAGAGGDLLNPGLGGWVEQNLRTSGAEAGLGYIFPEHRVRKQTRQIIAAIYGYANFNNDSLDVSLDLTPVKLRLSGAEGRQLIEQVLRAWPVCSVDEALLASALLLQGRLSELPRCAPPPDLLPPYLDMLQMGMDAASGAMPDSLRLIPQISGRAGGTYAVLRWSIRLSPLAALGFLTGGAALLGWKIRPLLSWAGPSLYAGGLIGLAGSGLAVPLLAWLLPLPLTALTPPLAELYIFTARIALTVLREFLLAWAAVSAVCAFAGLGLLLAAGIIERRAAEDAGAPL